LDKERPLFSKRDFSFAGSLIYNRNTMVLIKISGSPSLSLLNELNSIMTGTSADSRPENKILIGAEEVKYAR